MGLVGSGLRVLDASIIRLPLGVHYQYALADKAVDSI